MSHHIAGCVNDDIICQCCVFSLFCCPWVDELEMHLMQLETTKTENNSYMCFIFPRLILPYQVARTSQWGTRQRSLMSSRRLQRWETQLMGRPITTAIIIITLIIPVTTSTITPVTRISSSVSVIQVRMKLTTPIFSVIITTTLSITITILILILIIISSTLAIIVILLEWKRIIRMSVKFVSVFSFFFLLNVATMGLFYFWWNIFALMDEHTGKQRWNLFKK